MKTNPASPIPSAGLGYIKIAFHLWTILLTYAEEFDKYIWDLEDISVAVAFWLHARPFYIPET